MKLWREFLANPYKFLWSRIGGRKWTHIWRDIYHTAPVIIQTLWFLMGVLVYSQFGWYGVGVFWAIYLFGFLEGHFHWGKKWIKGQGAGGYEE